VISFRINQPGVKVALCACLLAMVVVALGAFTRLVDAGLGCPDWPGCYGQVMWPNTEAEIATANSQFADAAPVDTDKTWPEMVHRYFASGLGLVVIGLLMMTRRLRLRPKKLPVFLLGLVILQGLFGMWTVTLKLWPQVVTTHLLGGFTTLALLWLLALRLARNDEVTPDKTPANGLLKKLRVWAALGLGVVFLQIALGGWTTSNYAALACIDFPTCHQQWLPETDFKQGFDLSQKVGPNYLGGLMDNQARTAIHLSHRLGALVVTVVLSMLVFMLWRCVALGSASRRLAMGVAGLLAVQIGLGISNVVFALPLFVAVAHNGIGALLLLSMVTVNYYLYAHHRSQANSA